MRNFCVVLLLLVISFFAGCATRGTAIENPQLARTLVGLSDAYLEAIAKGNANRIGNLVMWPEYLSERGDEYTQKDYLQEMKKLNETFTPSFHPLLELTLLEVYTNENEAKVRLARKDWPVENEFWIEFTWVDSGWLISDDSLFGPGNQIEYLLEVEAQKNSAEK